MSAVWIVITIPSKDYEIKLNESEKHLDSLKRHKNGNNRSELHTINEANENINNEYKNKINAKEPLFETIVEDSLEFLGIDDAIFQKSKNGNYCGISFAVDLEDSDAVLQYFKSRDVGSRFGSSIGIIPFSLYCYEEEPEPYDEIESEETKAEKEGMRKLSNFKSLQSNFLKSVTARLTVAQIVENVRNGASLTFDFICYIIFASWIAAMGLLDNSVVSLVASMLVSPMMGPVMAMTFGTVIKDGSLRRLGFRNLMVCFCICILFGYFFGLIALNFTEHWADQEWPTNMMRERGLPRIVWVGTLVAFPSGCAVAISLLAGNEASLVGVAISVSLLPPAVNTGLLWAFATLKALGAINEQPTDTYYPKTNVTYHDLRPSLTPAKNYIPFYNDNMAIESAILGCLSLVLSIINIINIFIGAVILLKIKEIAPLSTMSPGTRRFFQEDLRIVREYNAEHGSNSENMGEQVLKEWADMNGIDANELLSDKPEARVTQIQTLNDIVRDVEADEVYRSVTRTRLSVNNNAEMFLRRMSHSLFQPPQSAPVGFTNAGFVNDGTRRSSQCSVNTSNFRVSGVEMGAIAHRRRNGRRGSRISQISPSFAPESDDLNSIPPSQPETPTFIKMPLSAGVRPLNGSVFTFGDNLLANDGRGSNRLRRNSQLLRRSLRYTEHSPYSLWPSARQSPNIPRFLVTPVSEGTVPEIKVDQ